MINAGGVINGSGEILGQYDAAAARRAVMAIGPRLDGLFERAIAQDLPPSRVANAWAAEVLESARGERLAPRHEIR